LTRNLIAAGTRGIGGTGRTPEAEMCRDEKTGRGRTGSQFGAERRGQKINLMMNYLDNA